MALQRAANAATGDWPGVVSTTPPDHRVVTLIDSCKAAMLIAGDDE